MQFSRLFFRVSFIEALSSFVIVPSATALSTALFLSSSSYALRKSGYSNPYTPILIERYAQCAISTKEFFEIKNEIESNNIDSVLSERLAKGQLSYNEFKSRRTSETQ